MKTNNLLKTFSATTALLLTFGVTGANAQDNDKKMSGSMSSSMSGTKSMSRKVSWYSVYGDRASLLDIPVDYMKSSLNLTDDQATKIQVVQDKYRSLRELDKSQWGVKPSGDASTTINKPTPLQMREWESERIAAEQKIAEEIKSNLSENERSTAFPLFIKETDTLVKAGIPVEALPELSLTADQKSKLVDMVNAMPSSSTKLISEYDPEEKQDRCREMQRKALEGTMSILTDAQKDILKKYEAQRQEKTRTDERGTPKLLGLTSIIPSRDTKERRDIVRPSSLLCLKTKMFLKISQKDKLFEEWRVCPRVSPIMAHLILGEFQRMKTNFWKTLGASSALVLLFGTANTAKAQDDPAKPVAPVPAPMPRQGTRRTAWRLGTPDTGDCSRFLSQVGNETDR